MKTTPPLFLLVLLSLLALLSPAASPASVTFQVDSEWEAGFQATVTIHNGTSDPVVGWHAEFDLPHAISSIWDGSLSSQQGGRVVVSNVEWNQTIAAGGSASFGFTAAKNGQAITPPSACCVNGVPTSVNGGPLPEECRSAPPPPPPPPPTGGGGSGNVPSNLSGRKVIGYYTAWSVYGRDYHVAEIPADHLTHINYAFANVTSGGEAILGDPYADIDKFYPGDSWDVGALRGNFNQLLKLKAAHPHLLTLISVGGWTWSGNFSPAAATAAGRKKFAESCLKFITDYGFDGVDIDWEYPVGGGLWSNQTSPADKQNYTLLLQELRTQLDQLGATDGRHYLLTIAAPAGPGTYVNLEIDKIHPYLDWINLMTYDFHGSWSPLTNFNAALVASSSDPSSDPQAKSEFNATAASNAYLQAGVPPEKLVLGTPFYGRGWQGVPNVNDGLYQPHSGEAQGTWEPAIFDYSDLVNNYLGQGYTRFFHPEAQVPWLFSPATGIMVSYDDPESTALKAELVLEKNMGGAMFWELSADDDAHALTQVLRDRLLTLAPYIDANTSGPGVGDFYLNLWAIPPEATHIIVLASATPAPGGVGTGPVFGLVPDAVFNLFAKQPKASSSPLHFPTSSHPYTSGPFTAPAGTASVLAGQTWEMVAVAYSNTAGFVGASGVVQVDW